VGNREKCLVRADEGPGSPVPILPGLWVRVQVHLAAGCCPPAAQRRSPDRYLRSSLRRRWTSENLDAASHTPDLVQRDRIWVNLDHAQQGIGTASCGPGVLPQHRLEALARPSR
jgi:Beta galactosidase small chain